MDCALIAELDGRRVAGELGYASTGVLLAERLHLCRREAAGRGRLAADLGPRRVPADDDQPDRRSDQDHHLQLALVNAVLAIGATMLAADESSRPSS